MDGMTPQEAKRILHPETTLEAYAETDYYGGFAGAKKWKEAVDEACLVACEALEKQIHKKPFAHGKYGFACPSCKQKLSVEREDIFVYDMKPPEHCEPCGQALDWSDE